MVAAKTKERTPVDAEHNPVGCGSGCRISLMNWEI